MSNTEIWRLAVIMGLAAVTVLTRSFFYISTKPWHLPHWAQRGLHYAPIAALAAVIVPETVMTQGHLINTWYDARLFAIATGAVWFFWRRGSRQAVLGTIVAGMLVYLPLHLGLSW